MGKTQGTFVELDDHDIPKSLTAAEIATMTPVQLWRVLKQHGWQYKRGKCLVDWYYIRPGRDVSAGTSVAVWAVDSPAQILLLCNAAIVLPACSEYTEGIDYFQADELLAFAQIHVLSRESEQQDLHAVHRTALTDVGGDHEAGNDKDEPAVHETRQEKALSPSRSPKLAKRARSVAANSTKLEGADTMRFAELWEKLKMLGWTSVYGSGLVERYYLCPGVDKHTGKQLLGC